MPACPGLTAERASAWDQRPACSLPRASIHATPPPGWGASTELEVRGLMDQGRLLIWLNGPLGLSKSSTAQALMKRLPCTLLFDRDPIGLILRPVLRTSNPWRIFKTRLSGVR
jgi:hypothetical protein